MRGQLGSVFKAPEAFRGSRSYWQRKFADAQAICRELGVPHLLVTFTMNNKAPEFGELLWPGQEWHQRPDIANRLFMEKAKEFINDMVHRQVMGPVKGWFYSVEHQDK
jgi:hypothetical protein